MKSNFLLLIAIFGLVSFTSAQEIATNAIGLRLGDSRGLGAEISYQRAILDDNRIELDFGWRNGKNYDGVKLVGLFQWVKLLEGNFNWYFGAGAGIGSYRYDVSVGNDVKDSFVFAAGDIGVEYNFDIPLLVSIDVRPELGFGEDVYDNNDLDFDVALSVRYRF